MKTTHTPQSKPKSAKFHVLHEDEDETEYEYLKAQRKHHPELDQAKIRLVWLIDVSSDADGRLVLGKAIKAPPLWQQTTGIDWFIGLNLEWWNDADNEQRAFLVGHELCHMAQKLDTKTEDQVIDDHGFLQWRTVKHDIGEFFGPIQRHGIRLRDVQVFYEVAKKAQKTLPFTASGAEVTVI